MLVVALIALSRGSEVRPPPKFIRSLEPEKFFPDSLERGDGGGGWEGEKTSQRRKREIGNHPIGFWVSLVGGCKDSIFFRPMTGVWGSEERKISPAWERHLV